MPLTRIEPPSDWPVTLDEVKRFNRIEQDVRDFDTELESFIVAATSYLDGRDGLLGRAIMAQQWKATYAMFPTAIELPLPPLMSVETLTYVDPNGVTQTLAPSAYTVTGIGDSDGACIRPAYGTSWPATRYVPEAVSIYFTAGYDTDPAKLPESLRQAILMHVALMFDQRSVVSWSTPSRVPLGYDELVAPFRIYGFGS